MIRILVSFLAALFVAELISYFGPDVAPDEQHIVLPKEPAPAPLGRFDPVLAPEVMAADCRREGKQLFATRSSGDWQYGCVRADGRTR